jgi:hypothetical protein
MGEFKLDHHVSRDQQAEMLKRSATRRQNFEKQFNQMAG